MALGEGATLAVLTGETDAMPLIDQGGES